MRTPRPVAPDQLPELLADWLLAVEPARLTHPLRVGIDAAPAAEPAALADHLVDPLRVRGRPALRVDTRWFLRPASVRLERGRTDPDSYYEDRLDVRALRREVLDRLGPAGDHQYLATFWDPDTDRATRAPYRQAPARSVLLLTGSFLLGSGLPLDLTVHLRLSAAALARRTPAEDRWTLPAFSRYEAEVRPSTAADLVVRLDDPGHPALSYRAGR